MRDLWFGVNGLFMFVVVNWVWGEQIGANSPLHS